jgi:PAS domain S-box-containing protein
MKEARATLPAPPSNPPRSWFDPYSSLIGTVRDRALFFLDPEGIVATWNPGGEAIYGYTADEVIGQHVSLFYTIDVVAGGDLDELLRILPANGPCEAEEVQVRRNGELFRGRVTISPLRDRWGGHAGFALSVLELGDPRDGLDASRGSAQRRSTMRPLRTALAPGAPPLKGLHSSR